MDFKSYVVDEIMVTLDTDSKSEALDFLARELCRKLKLRRFKPIIEDFQKREDHSASFIGQGVAIPKAFGPIKEKFAVIVGRSTEGINYDAARNAKVNLIVMVIIRDDVEKDEQIEFLAGLSTAFKSDAVSKQLKNDEIDHIDELFHLSVEEHVVESDVVKKKKNIPVISAAITLARDVDAKAILIFADTKQDNEFLKHIKSRRKVIIVTSNKSRFSDEDLRHDLIQAPAMKTSGLDQIKVGILLALSRNLLHKDDHVICVAGGYGKDKFDTVVLIDIAREFGFFFAATRSLISSDVKPEILERVLGIASEIGMEGREGKALGTIFVIGDTNRVNTFVSQLIINPFRGYTESERNVLDPGLEETIKEFASIDGAFIITGEGVVLSAGSYLRPIIPQDMELPELPSGLGARHAAAMGITACSNALAITISESTGQVTLFKNGAIALTLSRQAER